MAADNIPNGDEQITDEDAELWLDAVEYYVEAGLEADESQNILADEYEQFDVGPIDLRLVVLGPRTLLLRDKLSFLVGSTLMWVCAYWLGAEPHTFFRMYTVVGAVLFAARYAVYRARKWHYYLLDLCYFCNALLLLHLWVFPQSRLLALVTFSFNTGPLAASILAFRNSLVYHDLDKVTSLFMHLVPTCVSWCNRWHTDTEHFGAAYNGEGQHAGFVSLVLIPLAFYVCWAVLYWHTVFVVAAERIRRRSYVTLFTFVTTQSRGMFHTIARRVPTQQQPVVYLLLHMCFCATTMLCVATLSWHSRVFHSGVMAASTTISVWHGANYYFEVFVKRYQQKLAAQGSPAASPATLRKEPAPPAAATATASSKLRTD